MTQHRTKLGKIYRDYQRDLEHLRSGRAHVASDDRTLWMEGRVMRGHAVDRMLRAHVADAQVHLDALASDVHLDVPPEPIEEVHTPPDPTMQSMRWFTPELNEDYLAAHEANLKRIAPFTPKARRK